MNQSFKEIYAHQFNLDLKQCLTFTSETAQQYQRIEGSLETMCSIIQEHIDQNRYEFIWDDDKLLYLTYEHPNILEPDADELEIILIEQAGTIKPTKGSKRHVGLFQEVKITNELNNQVPNRVIFEAYQQAKQHSTPELIFQSVISAYLAKDKQEELREEFEEHFFTDIEINKKYFEDNYLFSNVARRANKKLEKNYASYCQEFSDDHKIPHTILTPKQLQQDIQTDEGFLSLEDVILEYINTLDSPNIQQMANQEYLINLGYSYKRFNTKLLYNYITDVIEPIVIDDKIAGLAYITRLENGNPEHMNSLDFIDRPSEENEFLQLYYNNFAPRGKLPMNREEFERVQSAILFYMPETQAIMEQLGNYQ